MKRPIYFSEENELEERLILITAVIDRAVKDATYQNTTPKIRRDAIRFLTDDQDERLTYLCEGIGFDDEILRNYFKRYIMNNKR